MHVPYGSFSYKYRILLFLKYATAVIPNGKKAAKPKAASISIKFIDKDHSVNKELAGSSRQAILKFIMPTGTVRDAKTANSLAADRLSKPATSKRPEEATDAASAMRSRGDNGGVDGGEPSGVLPELMIIVNGSDGAAAVVQRKRIKTAHLWNRLHVDEASGDAAKTGESWTPRAAMCRLISAVGKEGMADTMPPKNSQNGLFRVTWVDVEQLP